MRKHLCPIILSFVQRKEKQSESEFSISQSRGGYLLGVGGGERLPDYVHF